MTRLPGSLIATFNYVRDRSFLDICSSRSAAASFSSYSEGREADIFPSARENGIAVIRSEYREKSEWPSILSIPPEPIND